MKYVFLLQFAFLTISISAQDTLMSIDQSDWTTFKADEYSIQHPTDWEVNKEGTMGTSFYLFSPMSSATDAFRENINLIKQDVSAYNMNLDQYAELSVSQIPQFITDGKIISSERMKDHGEYQAVTFTGKQGIYDLKFLQFYWIHSGNAYVLTLTCAITSFDEYVDLGKTIMGSFKVD